MVMAFPSFAFFLLFLPAAVAISHFARRSGHDDLRVRGGLSLAFYALCAPQDLPVVALSLTVNWSLVCLWMGGQVRRSRSWLTLIVISNLFVWSLFKYFDPRGPGYSLPLGLSYFTFTQIAFLVDMTRGQIKTIKFSQYLVFATWFPHLPAGPLLAPRTMLPQLQEEGGERNRGEDMAVGLTLIAMGLFKKTILAPIVIIAQGDVFLRAGYGQSLGIAEVWIACIAKLFELYLDFSGYSEIALGVSRMLGVNLPLNFVAPLRSTSPVEFWTRWHITLGRFMHDYLYAPLTRGRIAWRYYGALIVVMFVIAMWHGTTIPMALFGLFHGITLGVTHGLRRAGVIGRGASRLKSIRLWGGRALTVGLISFSMSFWQANDWPMVVQTVLPLIGLTPQGVGAFHSAYALIVVVAVAVVWSLPDGVDVLAQRLVGWVPMPHVRCPPALVWRGDWRWSIFIAVILALALVGLPQSSGFRYAEF